MGARWLDTLREFCGDDAALFYLARWCQKKSGALEPSLEAFDASTLRESAGQIARHLAEDGPRVERLVTGEEAALWTELLGELLASARSRVGPSARQYADEALQKVAIVLLTGTPPSRAADELHRGPDGPRNEYVFDSPFSGWARMIVINLIRDDLRQRTPRPPAPEGGKSKPSPLETDLLARATEALPGLVAAIGELPPVQRSVMVLTLSRRDVDDEVYDRLHELDSELFPEEQRGIVVDDRDIAERLDTTPRNVTASRSVARQKLAERNPPRNLLLDALLPHRSTKPAREKKV